jgi:hypothetical protein
MNFQVWICRPLDVAARRRLTASAVEENGRFL